MKLTKAEKNLYTVLKNRVANKQSIEVADIAVDLKSTDTWISFLIKSLEKKKALEVIRQKKIIFKYKDLIKL